MKKLLQQAFSTVKLYFHNCFSYLNYCDGLSNLPDSAVQEYVLYIYFNFYVYDPYRKKLNKIIQGILAAI